MKRFELLDTSGDAGITAFGSDPGELFVNAAEGMYHLMTDPEDVSPHRSIAVEIESDSLEGLLVSWLNELIFHFDTYGFIGREIRMDEFRDTLIKATLTGGEFDPEKHGSGLLIKAATYHRLRVERKADHWEADVVFDI
jgi:SHS2 domain-containing protein